MRRRNIILQKEEGKIFILFFFREILDGRKVGHFLITIQKSFKLIFN